MSPPISTMMKKQVWSAHIDDSVASVEHLLAEHQLSWVPLRDDTDHLVGVVSASDLLQFHARRLDPGQVPAWQVCSYRPIVVAPTATIAEVAFQMVARRLHHAVVMEGDAMKGVVSSLDFVRAFVGDGSIRT